jgi:tRNA(fMet)-specific endonuclease VapC
VKYVLDTNAVSALMRADAAAIGRLKTVARNEVAVPQPVISEIQYGLARLPRGKRKRMLEERWALFARELPRAAWTDEVSVQFGKLKADLERKGLLIEDFDVAIAAHALADDAVLVTANAKHMRRIDGLALEDWTERAKSR